MGTPSPFVVGAYLLSFGLAALAEARRLRPDLVLGHWVLPTGPVAAFVAKARRVPLVLVAHGSDIHRYALSSRVAGRIAASSLRASRLAIASCQRIRGLLVQTLGVPAQKVRILPMGIDERIFGKGPAAPPSAEERAELRSRLGLDPSAKILLFVGDLLREKGLVELTKAHQALLGRGLGVDLVVVGSGPLGRDFLAPRARLQGSRIRLVGRVPQVELSAWYRAADLHVLPSWGEGSPLVVMEALASGVPVVASSVGGIPELVEDGVTGRLVPATDERTLADTLEEALRSESLERLRGALVGRAFDFGAARRAAELRGFLSDLLDEEGGARA
jgi:glycosyltransferase involved in cell wall biosynthesis